MVSAVTLAAHTTYYLLSSEVNGGDQWYDVASSVTSTAVTVNSGIYRTIDSDNNPVYNPYGTAGHSYGPVNLRYDTAPNLLLGKTATASSQWDASQSPANAVDGSYSTNWQAGSGTSFGSQWLQVNLGTAQTFNTVTIGEYRDNRTSGWVLEYQDSGGTWHTAYTGTTIGTGLTRTFTAVTASVVRLRFTSGTYTPIIFEFQLRNQ